MKKNKQILGIIGGMGPAATVQFQKLIIEKTKALVDQEHIEVITYNNPEIPDRTQSLADDGGVNFSNAIIETGQKLIQIGATILCIPCNTAHARFERIQKALPVPIVNMVSITIDYIQRARVLQPILILGTQGLINSSVFGSELTAKGIAFILPNQSQQRAVTNIIYSIKSGNLKEQVQAIEKIITEWNTDAKSILLGCTELSLLAGSFKSDRIKIVDPLSILAEYVVKFMK